MSELSYDDIAYALETTRVVREPDRLIDTFGTTQFEFHLLTEPMDQVGVVRLREGKMDAQQPTILRPERFAELVFEGFGEQAEQFAKWFEHFGNIGFFKYGFDFAKREFRESEVHDSIEAVSDRILADIDRTGSPSRAVILGVDDTWEISLLKFTFDLIGRSSDINLFDFKRRGLL
ncbi:MAG: hypothetical protein AAF236_16565 [Verrucomicrobiota bacterium]